LSSQGGRTGGAGAVADGTHPDRVAQPSASAGPERGFGLAVDSLNSLGSLLIIAIMVLVCADIASRGLFNWPIDGVSELVGIAIVVIVFLQFASTLRHGRMARADLFINTFRARHPLAGGLLQAFFDFAGLVVCAVMVWATWPRFAAAWSGNEFVGVHGQFTAPTWPVRFVVMLGAAVALVQFAILIVEEVRAAIARRSP
jgi:TRAP-type mannitol/chloroaromatic compound transport system permease small subunit